MKIQVPRALLALLSLLMLLAMAVPLARAQGGASLANFVGTWKTSDGLNTVTIDASGSGTDSWVPNGSQSDVSTWSGCVASDFYTMICNWTGTYQDSDKTIVRHGTIAGSVSGNTLTLTSQVTGIDSENWHVGRYTSGAESGGTATLQRVGAGPENPYGGGNGGGNNGQQAAQPMQVSIACDHDPLVITISELPSRPCTLWIGGWIHNTASPVQVFMPDATDGYGNHANGIQIFGANQVGSGQGIAPYNMGGYQAPDGNYGEWYPWNILVFACPAQQGTGANCYNSVTSPGAFSVPFIVHQDGLPDTRISLFGTAVPHPGAGIGGTATGATAPFRIHNRWRTDQYLNIEVGYPQSSPIQASWWSALWVIEPVPGTAFVRFNNRWKPGEYLNIEHGLGVSPIQDSWWSAMWSMEPVAGANGIYRIRNAWKQDEFLNVEAGHLQCSPIQGTWWSAMWSFEQ